jgi:hypothetical protein
MADNNFSDTVDLDSDNEFIDIESDYWKSGKDGYEAIMLRHLNECVKVLSMDKYSCYDKIKTKDGYEHIIKKNLNELIIRSVDTLRILMVKQLMRNDTYNNQIKLIIKQCREFEKNYGNKEVFQPGYGNVKISQLILTDEHPIKKQLIDYIAKRYRLIFEILIKTYMKAKDQAREDSIDRAYDDDEEEEEDNVPVITAEEIKKVIEDKEDETD